MSDSVWPHRWQPTRLPSPWDSPGKNTGVGCHFLLQCRKVKSESEVAQSCPTLGDPMDCRPPGSSIHGIFQARVLEWGAIAFSKKFLYFYFILSTEKCVSGITFFIPLIDWSPLPFFNIFIYFELIDDYFTILVDFCHTSTWINHRCTYVPSLLNLSPTSCPFPHL